ncbi:UNVERIFIED_CONTAM: hypothetical protein HDU68_012320 [Siphonaria sp. JEL0065]|nr:hypothetical protein HDU68_012320 [Siphonaria sp. JEL0065]
MSFTDVPLVGRKSFKNFNKEIESLAQSQESQQRLKKSEKVDARESLSDKELASRYKTLSADEKKGKKRKAMGGGDALAAAGSSSGKSSSKAKLESGEDGSEHGSSQRFKFLKPSVGDE